MNGEIYEYILNALKEEDCKVERIKKSSKTYEYDADLTVVRYTFEVTRIKGKSFSFTYKRDYDTVFHDDGGEDTKVSYTLSSPIFFPDAESLPDTKIGEFSRVLNNALKR